MREVEVAALSRGAELLVAGLASTAEGHPLGRWGAGVRTAVYAVVYAVAVLPARGAGLDGDALPLTWPAAAVAVPWLGADWRTAQGRVADPPAAPRAFGADWRRGPRWSDAGALVAVTVAVTAATGASPLLAVGLAGVPQAARCAPACSAGRRRVGWRARPICSSCWRRRWPTPSSEPWSSQWHRR